jgi:hypothetical protein
VALALSVGAAEDVIEALGAWLATGRVAEPPVCPDVAEGVAVAVAVVVTVVVTVALGCSLLVVGAATTTFAAAD